MRDNEIIDLYWSRDERAIEESDTKYGAYCYVVAQNILQSHEDSEECVSDTWLRAWKSIPPQRPSVLRAFLAKITRNLALDKYRAQGAKKRGNGQMNVVLDELAECLDDSRSVEGEIEAKELRRMINSFVKSLSDREGDIFIRRYFYVESVADIADRYEISENYVSVMLSRTRKKLRKYLEQRGVTV